MQRKTISKIPLRLYQTCGSGHFRRSSRGWTGEDSNLRSPQGAADLQSAGFSHSPTRPANSFGTLDHVPPKIFGTQLHRPAQTTRTRPDISTGNIAMQKGLVSEDTSPSAFVARNPSATLPKALSLKTQLAEGVEPPTL